MQCLFLTLKLSVTPGPRAATSPKGERTGISPTAKFQKQKNGHRKILKKKSFFGYSPNEIIFTLWRLFYNFFLKNCNRKYTYRPFILFIKTKKTTNEKKKKKRW